MKTKTLGRKWGEWVVKNRLLVIFISFITLFVSGYGMKNITMSGDYRYFFKDGDPQVLAFTKLQQVYSNDDSVTIAIKPPSGTIYNKDTLSFVHELTTASWQVPFSYRVDSLSNFQATKASEDELQVRDFIRDGDSLDKVQIGYIQSSAEKEPLLMGQIVAKDGGATVINIRVNLPGKTPFEVPEVANYVRKMTDDIKAKYPGHEVYLSGLVMMNNAFNEAGMKDMSTLTPLMYLVILIISIFFLKSFLSTFATLIILLFSIIGGMGVGGWLGIPITPPSSMAPTVILTLAVADSIHILKSVLTYMRRGMAKTEALIEGVRVNFLPVFLTSLTTAIGFLSLNSADTPPLHDLGNITAAGVLFAFFYSVTLLPALISYFPIRVKVVEESQDLQRNWLVGLGDWTIKNRGLVITTTVLATGFLFYQVPQIALNDRFVKYFTEDIEFRKDSDWITDNMTGIYQLNFDLSSGESQGVSDPDFLKKVDDFANMYRSYPGVHHVNTITDTFKRLNKNMHGDDQGYYSLPESRELAAQYLLLYEMSLPYGLDLNNQINVDKSSTRLIITTDDLPTADFIKLAEHGESWLGLNAPEMSTNGSGPTLMFSYISTKNVRAMFTGTLLAFFLITLTMMIALRSWKYGLVSILPNVIPAGLAMGIWSVAVGEAGFAISIVVSVTLGIVVDDSVHFLTKYVRAKREGGLNPAESIRNAFTGVGPALVATSVILTAGFGVMMMSTFKMNWVLGSLSAITIALALLIDLTFLPALLSIIDKGETKDA